MLFTRESSFSQCEVLGHCKNQFCSQESFTVCLPGQAPPAGAMQLLPKRTILEKGNGGAASVFNPSMFHYQQALANMQLQQPAFIPTGECLAVFAIPVWYCGPTWRTFYSNWLWYCRMQRFKGVTVMLCCACARLHHSINCHVAYFLLCITCIYFTHDWRDESHLRQNQ